MLYSLSSKSKKDGQKITSHFVENMTEAAKLAHDVPRCTQQIFKQLTQSARGIFTHSEVRETYFGPMHTNPHTHLIKTD